MGRIAQLVEQKTLNLLVGGSSPPAPTITLAKQALLCYNNIRLLCLNFVIMQCIIIYRIIN